MKYNINFDIEFEKNRLPGTFIAVEGIDGSGKTTQAERIVDILKKKGYKAVYTKEPTTGIFGRIFREEILSGKVKVPPVSIQYLGAADRGMHQVEIQEELKKGKIVITDRYFWSAIAYGVADMGTIKSNLNYYTTALSALSFYHRFLRPDITFFLEIPIKEALNRIGGSQKHNEIYDNEEKLKNIYKAYNMIVEKFPREFQRVNAGVSVEDLSKELVRQVERKVR